MTVQSKIKETVRDSGRHKSTPGASRQTQSLVESKAHQKLDFYHNVIFKGKN